MNTASTTERQWARAIDGLGVVSVECAGIRVGDEVWIAVVGSEHNVPATIGVRRIVTEVLMRGGGGGGGLVTCRTKGVDPDPNPAEVLAETAAATEWRRSAPRSR